MSDMARPSPRLYKAEGGFAAEAGGHARRMTLSCGGYSHKLAADLPPLAVRARKANVSFIYGAIYGEQNEWAGIWVKSIPCEGCF